MATFDDLEFEPHFMGALKVSEKARISFPNGYQASVIRGPYTYGGSRGLFEIGFMDADSNLLYDTPFVKNDAVIGYLTRDEVTAWLHKLEALPNRYS